MTVKEGDKVQIQVYRETELGYVVIVNQIHQGLATQVLGHAPGVGLVDPHERGFDQEPFVHAQGQGELHGLHGVVAAIGVT